jgi:hypothetical protein
MMPERTFLLPVAPRSRGRVLLLAVFLVVTALVSDMVIERVERIYPDRGCNALRCWVIN